MNFSLILNTRKRIQRVNELIDSVTATTSDLRNVEMFINCDEDDLETISFLESKINNVSFRVVLWIGERPSNLHISINEMARESSGDYIFVLNDDVLFKQKGWDEIVLNKIDQFKEIRHIEDDILYCRTYDNSVDKANVPGRLPYASFPIISREAVKALGFFMHENFVGLGADAAIHEVYSGINRIVDIPEIVLDHVYHNALPKVVSPDQTAFEMRQNTNRNQNSSAPPNILENMGILNEYIKGNYKRKL